MRFFWDENKDLINYKKHGVYFETATLVFDDPNFLMLRDRDVSGEERWHTIGLVDDVMLLLVVHTLMGEHDEEIVRIISAREATARERRLYEDGEA